MIGFLIIIGIAIIIPSILYYRTVVVYRRKIKNNFNKIKLEDSDIINEIISEYKIGTENKNDYLEFCTKLSSILRKRANYELGNNIMKIKIIFGGYSYEKILNHLAIECTTDKCHTRKNSTYESMKEYIYYISNLINSELKLYCQTIIIEK